MRLWGPALVGLLLVGCATRVGEPLPPGEISVIREGSGGWLASVEIFQVDDHRVGRFANRVEVPPGEHLLYLGLVGRLQVARWMRHVRIQTEPGREYVVDGNWSMSDSWIAITDTTTGAVVTSDFSVQP
jgi:hypothetical protein